VREVLIPYLGNMFYVPRFNVNFLIVYGNRVAESRLNVTVCETFRNTHLIMYEVVFHGA
jgi:hypothetical protein